MIINRYPFPRAAAERTKNFSSEFVDLHFEPYTTPRIARSEEAGFNSGVCHFSPYRNMCAVRG